MTAPPTARDDAHDDARSAQHAMSDLVRDIRGGWPRSRRLSDDVWRSRHTLLLGFLGLHAIGLPAYALIRGIAPVEALASGVLLAALVALAAVLPGRQTRQIAMALGLLTCSALVVRASEGMFEAHFHFFLVVGALMLYQSWWPFLVAGAFTLLHHGALGTAFPDEVYAGHTAASADPWHFAFIHAGFVLAASATHLVSWRMNELDLERTQRRLRAANLRMNIILEAASDAIVGLNAAGIVTFANRTTCQLLGQAEAELVGAELHALLHTDCGQESCELERNLRAGGPAAIESSVLVGGSHRLLEGDVRPAYPATRRTLSVVTLRDVTERRAQAQALSDAQSRFSVAFEAAPIGMVITDANGRFLRVNKAFCELTGFTRVQLEGPEVRRLAHPEDRLAEDRVRAELVAGRIPAFHLDQRLLRADGDTRWVKVSASLVEGAASPEIIMQVEDITKARRAEQLLAHRSLHDSLTGLANRTLLVDRIEHALSTRDRRGVRDEVAVLFIDLDRFKHTNDALGHEVADRVLVAMANRIRAVLRPGDTAARIGGDEFVVLCEELAADDVQEMAARLHQVIKAPLIVGTAEVRVSASIGVVLATDGDTASDLLRDADTAMYTAKERGRSRTEVFDTALRAVTTQRLHLETSLGQALSNDEIEVVYQPTVDLRTGQTEGVEALVRWRHTEHGILTPSAFLDVAEDTGLIVPIGLYVLNEALRQATVWQTEEHRDLVVAVNLSAMQLNRPGLPAAICRLLEGHGTSPTALRLEITESILVDAGSHTTSNLKALQELGVSIGIDDFGTGYSSLTYLKRFPVDFIKIDKSFVEGLGADREDTAIVQAIIALGSSLGLSTIAEGVESPEQAHLLRDLGCHFAQGYLFGRPEPAAVLTEGLRATTQQSRRY
jgi:diguanylate cyclase (GGDEF)-like protein/PAS domain S-box-containing protein